MRNQKSRLCLRPGAASTSPANKTPKSISRGKTPPRTEISLPKAWGLIPQTSPRFPQTWGLIAEAWGRGVGAGPPFPHVSKLVVVSQKHPDAPWGNCVETRCSFPQAWGMIPQPWGTSPQMWEYDSRTWGFSPQASKPSPQASPAFPQVWGNIPQTSGMSAGGWDSSFETWRERGAKGSGRPRPGAKRNASGLEAGSGCGGNEAPSQNHFGGRYENVVGRPLRRLLPSSHDDG